MTTSDHPFPRISRAEHDNRGSRETVGRKIHPRLETILICQGCFGQYLDVQNYENYIKQFMTTYRSLPISIPLKLHVLESHAVEFLKDMGEQFGLGFFSEQSYEAMHKKQKANWGTTPLREDHPEYGPKLKALVVNSNGKNL